MSGKTNLVKSLVYSFVRVNKDSFSKRDTWRFKHYRNGEVVLQGTSPTSEEAWDKVRNFRHETEE